MNSIINKKDGGVLNIVTATKADYWVYTHIPRFVHYLDNYAGPCKKHILLCVSDNKENDDEVAYMVEQLNIYFDVVKVLYRKNPWKNDRTLFFDQLRAEYLSLFDLEEALYLDPDVDVLEDLSKLPHMHIDSNLLWVSNTLPVRYVEEEIQNIPNTKAAPPIEPGFMYMRKSFKKEMNEAIKQHPPDTLKSIPGLFYWELVKQYQGDKATQLYGGYHRTFWDLETCIKLAATVHYTGRWKYIQSRVEYVRDGEDSHLKIHPKPIVHEGYEIKKFSDIQ